MRRIYLGLVLIVVIPSIGFSRSHVRGSQGDIPIRNVITKAVKIVKGAPTDSASVFAETMFLDEEIMKRGAFLAELKEVAIEGFSIRVIRIERKVIDAAVLTEMTIGDEKQFAELRMRRNNQIWRIYSVAFGVDSRSWMPFESSEPILNKKDKMLNGLFATECQDNLKQLSLAMLVYVADSDDQFPPASNWSGSLVPYLKKSTEVFRCPARSELPVGYAFNSSLGGQNIESFAQPGKTILFFESKKGGPSPAGGGQSWIEEGVHGNSSHMALLDGTVRGLVGRPDLDVTWGSEDHKLPDELNMRVPPVIVGGEIMVPVREIFEWFGARVFFSGGEIIVRKDKTVVSLIVGSKMARVAGKYVLLQAAPTVLSGRTMVPLEFVGETMGATVSWIKEEKAVFISHNGRQIMLRLKHDN